MSSCHQSIKWRSNIAENFNRLSRVHERYRQTDDRQTTDGGTTTYSKRSRSLKMKESRAALKSIGPDYLTPPICYSTVVAQLQLKWMAKINQPKSENCSFDAVLSYASQ